MQWNAHLTNAINYKTVRISGKDDHGWKFRARFHVTAYCQLLKGSSVQYFRRTDVFVAISRHPSVIKPGNGSAVLRLILEISEWRVEFPPRASFILAQLMRSLLNHPGARGVTRCFRSTIAGDRPPRCAWSFLHALPDTEAELDA